MAVTRFIFAVVGTLAAVAVGALLFGGMTVIATPVFIFLWLEAVSHRRRARAARVLDHLEVGVRLNAPLPDVIEAAADSERGGVQRRLRHLARSLKTGTSLSAALAGTVPELSARDRALIAAAERAGRLAPVLADLTEERRASRRPHSPWLTWVYPVGLSLAILSMLSVATVFLFPKFSEIFADFDATLPTLTEVVLSLIPREGPALGTSVYAIPVVALIISVVAFQRIFTLPPRVTLWYRDPIMRIVDLIPFVGSLFRDRQLADALLVVDRCVEASMPMQVALSEAQGLRVSPAFRRRLGRWSSGIVAGRGVAEAARRADMPPLIVGMLSTATAAAHPREAIGFLHRYYRSRFTRGMELARAAVTPVTVVILGGVVGCVVLALMAPVFEVIEIGIAQWGSP